MRLLLVVALVAAASAREAATSVDLARSFLTSTFGLSRADISRLDAGQVVSRTLDTTHRREVATLGVVRIPTDTETYVEHLTDIATFKRTEDVFQIGKFSDPPHIGDVAGLTLDDGEVRRLEACRVDDCGAQLSAAAIQQFARVDWGAADAAARATGVMRQVLVDYAARYRQSGAAALMVYADSSPRLDVRGEFAALVDSDGTTWPHLGGLRQHVLDDRANRGDATGFIYWSKERVHKRGVISATHVSILRQAADRPVRVAIASKQIYAMHYFDASLGLTLLVPERSSSTPAVFVVYLNRSRIDLFDGMFGGVTRRIVSGRARSLVAAQLTRLQGALTARPPATAP